MAEQFHDTTELCPCSLPVCATLASCLCFQTGGISIIRAFAVANTESTKWVQSSDTFTMNITVIFYMNRDLSHLSLVIYNQNLKKFYYYWEVEMVPEQALRDAPTLILFINCN